MTRIQDFSTAQALTTLRSQIGMTQAELAAALGISRRSVVSWEASDSTPKADTLKKLIAIAVEHDAFPPGRAEADVRALWKLTRQKVLLNEQWLKNLLNLGALSEAQQAASIPAPVERRALINLPFQPSVFFGRRTELTEIGHILADPSCHLLTLIGPGGTGKTRLAIEFAGSQVDAFADGVVFVPLASVGAASQIASAIAEALHIGLSGLADPTTQLIGFLRGRELLLILDNFEHLLDGADLVADLLLRAPRLTLLVTSRERLNLRSEWLLDVGGLAYPDERDRGDLYPLIEYSAIQLFAQRVTQLQPGFPLHEANLRTMARLCRQVDGMPLAIELAAAGARMMPLAEIERQIRSNLDVLATTFRDVPARHRSLRAVFDHSWALLTEPECVLLSRLAIFRGGFTAAAAAQVAGTTLPDLTALIDKSLLRPANTAQRDRVEPRFALLEPIREYALEKLDARQEVESLRRVHADYFMRLAEDITPQWDRPESTSTIERDDDNMRAALQWACDTGNATFGFELCWSLRKFWQRVGYYSEGRRWLDTLLAFDDADDSGESRRARLHGIHTAAWLASDQHDYAQSARLYEQSRVLSRALGEADIEMGLYAPEARQSRSEGQYRLAVALFEGAVAHHRTHGDRRSVSDGGIGVSFYELALVLREIGEFDRAAELFEECMAMHQAIGDREAITIGLMGLGDIARDQGNIALTRYYSRQSLDLARALSLQWAVGYSLNNLALAAYLEDDIAEASALCDESMRIFESIQADGGIAEVGITRGHLLLARGELSAARESLSESLRLALTYGPRLLLPAALEGLACVMVEGADWAQVVRLLGAASALRAQMGTPLRPADRPIIGRAEQAARSAMGDAAFDDIHAQAVNQPLDQIWELPRDSI